MNARKTNTRSIPGPRSRHARSLRTGAWACAVGFVFAALLALTAPRAAQAGGGQWGGPKSKTAVVGIDR